MNRLAFSSRTCIRITRFFFTRNYPIFLVQKWVLKFFKSLQKLLRNSCQNILISRKISGTFYAKSREKYMEFKENKEEFEGKIQEIFWSDRSIQPPLPTTTDLNVLLSIVTERYKCNQAIPNVTSVTINRFSKISIKI